MTNDAIKLTEAERTALARIVARAWYRAFKHAARCTLVGWNMNHKFTAKEKREAEAERVMLARLFWKLTGHEVPALDPMELTGEHKGRVIGAGWGAVERHRLKAEAAFAAIGVKVSLA